MTNHLFREVLDGRITVRHRIRPGVYFLPAGSFDPAAPTMNDLAAGIVLSPYVTITLPPQAGLTTVATDTTEARNRAIAEAVVNAVTHIDDMTAALNALGNSMSQAARDTCAHQYVTPAPKPWARNIATQKRRRRL